MFVDDFNEFIMGPINEKYCNIFYFIAIFVFISLILGICGMIYTILSGTRVSSTILLAWVSQIVAYFIIYLENRILYNMCQKVL